MSLKYRKFSLPSEKMQYHLKGLKRRSCDSKREAVQVLLRTLGRTDVGRAGGGTLAACPLRDLVFELL